MIQGGAILTFTFLLVALIPFVGPFVLILTPLPILYYSSRLGRLRGLTVLAVSFLAAYVILDLVAHRAYLSVLLMIGFTGVLLSEVLKRNFSVEKTLLFASLALFCCGTGFVLYHSFRSGIAPWRMVETYVARMIEENIKLYAQMNISDEQVQMIRENAPPTHPFFHRDLSCPGPIGDRPHGMGKPACRTPAFSEEWRRLSRFRRSGRMEGPGTAGLDRDHRRGVCCLSRWKGSPSSG